MPIILNIINDINNILILPKTLYIFDIDEVILTFTHSNDIWWNEKRKNYLKLYYDIFMTENMIYNEWINIMNTTKPVLLINNFNDILNKITENNSNYIFLTARKPFLKKLTILHLQYCNINIDDNKIFFDKEKGNKLLELFNNNINIYEYNNIIFIDDLIENINNVNDKLSIYSNTHNILLYNFLYLHK